MARTFTQHQGTPAVMHSNMQHDCCHVTQPCIHHGTLAVMRSNMQHDCCSVTQPCIHQGTLAVMRSNMQHNCCHVTQPMSQQSYRRYVIRQIANCMFLACLMAYILYDDGDVGCMTGQQSCTIQAVYDPAR